MKSRPNQDRFNERLGNLDKKIIDPRAFLEGHTNLWENKKDGFRQPIMYGNVVVPKRLLDFAWENTEPLYYKGERCVNFSLSYWEADEDKYHSEYPPIYTGGAKLYLNALREDVAEQIRAGYRALKPRNYR